MLNKLCGCAAKLEGPAISLARIAIGWTFITHATSKFWAWPLMFKPPMMFSLFWWAGAIEIVVGTMFILGLFTRFSAMLLSGEMAIGYFLVHVGDKWDTVFLPLANKGEAAYLFAFIFLVFMFIKPGCFSLDALMAKKCKACNSCQV